MRTTPIMGHASQERFQTCERGGLKWTADYQDGSGYGIFAQLLDEDGNLLGNELWPNSYAGTD